MPTMRTMVGSLLSLFKRIPPHVKTVPSRSFYPEDGMGRLIRTQDLASLGRDLILLIPDLGNPNKTIYSNTDLLPVAAPSEGYTPTRDGMARGGGGASKQWCGQGALVSMFKQNFQSSECDTDSENKK